MRPLTSDLLLRAYAMGIFPMARSRQDPRLYWIDPDSRGVLPLEGFHVPRSLRKTLERAPFQVRCDTAFEQVMLGCAEPTAERPDTWINDEIVRLFVELHHLGVAHSVETWRDGRLMGGLYGLGLGAAFFGESMFSRATDASKVALVHLVARLKRQRLPVARYPVRHRPSGPLRRLRDPPPRIPAAADPRPGSARRLRARPGAVAGSAGVATHTGEHTI